MVLYELCPELQGRETLICRCVNWRNYPSEEANMVLHCELCAASRPGETGSLFHGVVQAKQFSNPGVIAAGAARAGGSARLQAAIALQATPASDGLALGGGRGAGPAVTADGHGVGVERVDPRGTVG